MSRFEDNIEADLHRYELEDGWIVLVGKTDLDNELLSLKLADPNDLWFHVRGMPGSHVVLKSVSNRKQEAPKSVQKEAAEIAAWHSKGRKGGQVAVSCTRAKNVSKPRKSKTGTVSIRKEKVLKVYPKSPPAETSP